jgi:thymidine kinase
MAKLYFRYGTMGSSKTANALMVHFNYKQNKIPVALFKPASAIRDGILVRSRIGLEEVSIPVLADTDFTEVDVQKYKVLIVDECQFLSEKQVNQLRKIVDNLEIDVFCYGLRTDFRTKLFEGSKRLFEIADSIEEIKMVCECGKKALYNARLDENGNVMLSGEQVDTRSYTYKAMCSDCFAKAVEKSKKEEEFTITREIQEECFA